VLQKDPFSDNAMNKHIQKKNPPLSTNMNYQHNIFLFSKIHIDLFKVSEVRKSVDRYI